MNARQMRIESESHANNAEQEIRRLSNYFYHVESDATPGSAGDVVSAVIGRLAQYREAFAAHSELGEAELTRWLGILNGEFYGMARSPAAPCS